MTSDNHVKTQELQDKDKEQNSMCKTKIKTTMSKSRKIHHSDYTHFYFYFNFKLNNIHPSSQPVGTRPHYRHTVSKLTRWSRYSSDSLKYLKCKLVCKPVFGLES